jgi:hypothetical protein
MNADQLAVATLHVQQIQTWITGLAILLGPLAGVLFTLWFQSRKEAKDAKHKLFLALLAERKSPQVSTQVAQELNKIDVVFANALKVKSAWHEYYATLHGPGGEPRAHKWLELLSAMAKDLGYKGLTQLDLDKFYLPQGHVDDAEFRKKLSTHLSRVLENTEHFVVKTRASEKAEA